MYTVIPDNLLPVPDKPGLVFLMSPVFFFHLTVWHPPVHSHIDLLSSSVESVHCQVPRLLSIFLLSPERDRSVCVSGSVSISECCVLFSFFSFRFLFLTSSSDLPIFAFCGSGSILPESPSVYQNCNRPLSHPEKVLPFCIPVFRYVFLCCRFGSEIPYPPK